MSLASAVFILQPSNADHSWLSFMRASACWTCMAAEHMIYKRLPSETLQEGWTPGNPKPEKHIITEKQHCSLQALLHESSSLCFQ